MAAHVPPSHEALQQAAEWFAALRSSPHPEQDRRRWQDWLDQREEHRAAWRYVEDVSRRFTPLQGDPPGALAALQAARRRGRQRRQVLGGLAAVCAGLLGWTSWEHTALRRITLSHLAQYRTRVGEVQNLLLADGTRVWLNTASALNVHYSSQARLLELVAGEILIETAHDTARPFVVQAGPSRMTALGTRFTVSLAGESSYLAVYDGRVELDDSNRRQVINAGEQITFGPAGLWQLEPASRAREVWSSGVLLAEDVPLGVLLDELRRYLPGHLGVSPDAARLRVVGGFPLHDPDQVLALLEKVLPIQVKRPLPWWTAVELRPGR
ncbi:FecR domain-containing protein [Achromobacter pestifer]|uniref:Protein FecR n=1 Tax=Achromobacter pestifer TaxID=1353889 RepID=A0A6S6YJR5_9BURK|nr:FecR domain-containing protein [Achromobacter pestifer]CAB3628445.1 Protein FecR [Achromobacter pestifer]